jgi:DNA-binding MarR family transcriptional regulator
MPQTTETISAWLNLVQAQTVVGDALEARMQAEHGLSLAEHEVLVRLYREPERQLMMHDLAELLLLSKSGVTRLVDRLVQRELLTRGACETDRRVTYAVLTDQGAQLVEASYPDFGEALWDVLGQHLSTADLAALRKALRKVLAGNTAWEDERCNAPIPTPATASA